MRVKTAEAEESHAGTSFDIFNEKHKLHKLHWETANVHYHT